MYNIVVRNATIKKVGDGKNFPKTGNIETALLKFNGVESALVIRGSLHSTERFNDFRCSLYYTV